MFGFLSDRARDVIAIISLVLAVFQTLLAIASIAKPIRSIFRGTGFSPIQLNRERSLEQTIRLYLGAIGALETLIALTAMMLSLYAKTRHPGIPELLGILLCLPMCGLLIALSDSDRKAWLLFIGAACVAITLLAVEFTDDAVPRNHIESFLRYARTQP